MGFKDIDAFVSFAFSRVGAVTDPGGSGGDAPEVKILENVGSRKAEGPGEGAGSPSFNFDK